MAGLNGHRSAPNDHRGQPPLVCGPPAYHPSSPIDYVHPGMPCPQVDSPPVLSLQSSNCSDNGEELQAVNGPSCSATQAHQDELAASNDVSKLQEYFFHSQSLNGSSPAQAKDVHDSLPYPSVDCIQECADTPVPNGIPQKLALPRPKPKPQLSLKKDVLPWPDVPRPQPKPRLSLNRTSKVHASPDVISHQDSPIPSTASGDVNCSSKCAPTLSDSNLGVNDEVKTCSPSSVVSPDLNDVITCSSEVSEALSHVESVLSHAYAVLEHSITCDIKLHPPDESHLNSPPLSVTSASPESPFAKVAPVRHGSSTQNLCPTLYTGKKEEHLSPSGDKALGDENTQQPVVSPLIPHGSIDQSPNHAQSPVSSSCAYRSSLLSSKGLSLPVSHDGKAHHVVPCNLYLVPPRTNMDKPPSDKLSHSTDMLCGCHLVNPGITASHLHRGKTLLAKAACHIAKDTCRACAIPNRYIVHCHELLPKFLSQIDMSSDVPMESGLLLETVSAV